jgi:hypothetical protein
MNTYTKIGFLSIGILFFVAISAFNQPTSLKELFLTFIVFLYGLYCVYGVLFNTEIHMSGYTVPKGQRPILRVMLFCGGIIIMYLSINNFY